MTQARIFQIARGTISEIPPEQFASAKWIDSLTNQPTATVQLLPTSSITPANAPESLVIVPSQRESLSVPAYGPYEVTSYGWNGEGYTLQAAVGVDFAARFASGDNSVLNSIIEQITSFGTSLYEPFLGWTNSPSTTDGPHVAKLGTNVLAELAVASLYAVSNLGDLRSVASQGSAYQPISRSNGRGLAKPLRSA